MTKFKVSMNEILVYEGQDFYIVNFLAILVIEEYNIAHIVDIMLKKDREYDRSITEIRTRRLCRGL